MQIAVMSDAEDKVDRWDFDYLQQQVWALQETVERLTQTAERVDQAVERIDMEITLLRNDLDIIKREGCWRFIENPQHKHNHE